MAEMDKQHIEAIVTELAIRLGPKTTELAPGVTLITKNGQNFGNGIIVKEARPHPASAEYLRKTNQRVWLVETDFGHRTILFDREIKEFYTLGVQDNYDRWWNARCEAIKRSVSDG